MTTKLYFHGLPQTSANFKENLTDCSGHSTHLSRRRFLKYSGSGLTFGILGVRAAYATEIPPEWRTYLCLLCGQNYEGWAYPGEERDQYGYPYGWTQPEHVCDAEGDGAGSTSSFIITPAKPYRMRIKATAKISASADGAPKWSVLQSAVAVCESPGETARQDQTGEAAVSMVIPTLGHAAWHADAWRNDQSGTDLSDRYNRKAAEINAILRKKSPSQSDQEKLEGLMVEFNAILGAMQPDVEATTARGLNTTQFLAPHDRPFGNLCDKSKYYKHIWITCVEKCKRPTEREVNYVFQCYQATVNDANGDITVERIFSSVFTRLNRMPRGESIAYNPTGAGGAVGGIVLFNYAKRDEEAQKNAGITVIGYGGWNSVVGIRFRATSSNGPVSAIQAANCASGPNRDGSAPGADEALKHICNFTKQRGSGVTPVGRIKPTSSQRLSGPGEFVNFWAEVNTDEQFRGMNSLGAASPEILWRESSSVASAPRLTEYQNKYLWPTDRFRFHLAPKSALAEEVMPAIATLLLESTNEYENELLAETASNWW